VAHVHEIVSSIRSINPAARIFVLGLYNPYRRTPLRAWLDEQVDRWDARLITRFAAMDEVTVLRICDLLDRDDRISTLDHFHPGARGYAEIAERIAAAL
jgi:lysophospholipase L1-like esterase